MQMRSKWVLHQWFKASHQVRKWNSRVFKCVISEDTCIYIKGGKRESSLPQHESCAGCMKTGYPSTISVIPWVEVQPVLSWCGIYLFSPQLTTLTCNTNLCCWQISRLYTTPPEDMKCLVQENLYLNTGKINPSLQHVFIFISMYMFVQLVENAI